MKKVLIASDHAGFHLKSDLIAQGQYDWKDLGPDSDVRVDYPDYADRVASKVQASEEQAKQNLTQALEANSKGADPSNPCSPSRDESSQEAQVVGVLICGSGQGMAMRANKYPEVRAALCWSEEVAQLAREHNDANILCLGARQLETEEALRILNRFMNTSFAKGRHRPRVEKIKRTTQ